jgi:DNA-directed RNA polymerase subunit alpha
MSSRNLTQGGKLDMQIKVEKGRGYVPGNHAPPRRRAHQVHRPHRARTLRSRRCSRVSYSVESARVEQRTDLDKLRDRRSRPTA